MKFFNLKNTHFYSNNLFLFYIDILSLCNYLCSYCSVKDFMKLKHNKYLNLDKLTYFIKNLPHFNNRNKIILILGGEPTLHLQLKVFIKDNNDSIINIYSNFTNNIEYYNDLLEYNNFELTISYHFNKTVNAEYFFNKYLKLNAKKRNNIFNVVLFEPEFIDQNIKLFNLLYNFYILNNIPIHNLDISDIDSTSSYLVKYNINDYNIYNKLNSLLPNKYDLIYNVKTDNGLILLFEDLIFNNIKNNNYFYNWKCNAGIDCIYIDPDGNIYNCPQNAYFNKHCNLIGNIYTNIFNAKPIICLLKYCCCNIPEVYKNNIFKR